MLTRILLLSISLCSCPVLLSQVQQYNVRGTVLDEKKLPIPFATIVIKYIDGEDKTVNALSDSLGRINIKKVAKSKFTLRISFVGYEIYESDFYLSSVKPELSVGDIILKPVNRSLSDLTVISHTPAIVFKEDTVEYKADSFKVKKDADLEDLLRKMPGITVKRDGSIETQGKVVSKIKVNGKDFFDGDPQTATKNLPANIIDKVQVIDDYGESAGFTGFKSGEAQKIINIQLKKDKSQGYFARMENGYGTNDRYGSKNTLNYFGNERQFSVFNNNNNTGGSSFLPNNGKPFSGTLSSLIKTNNNIVDNLGGSTSVTSLLANQDIGFLSAIPNFGNGVNNNASYGVRYSEDGIKKLKLYFSYIYYQIDNDLSYISKGIQVLDPVNFDEDQNFKKTSKSSGHRIFSNFEYKADSFLTVKLIPTVTLTQAKVLDNGSFSNSYNGTFLNSNSSLNNTANTNSNYAFDLLIKKRFKRNKQTLFFESIFTDNPSSTKFSGENIFKIVNKDTTQQIMNAAIKDLRISNKIYYVIPFNKNIIGRITYGYDFARSSNNKQTLFYSPSLNNYIQNDLYSGLIEINTNTNYLGIDVKIKRKATEYTFGIGTQNISYYRNDQAKGIYQNSQTNLLPFLQINYQFSRTRILSFKYSGSIKSPDPSQLLPVSDTTNPLISYKGNIGLKPEFINSGNLSYYNFDYINGNLLLLGIVANKTFNKIIPSIELTSGGKTLISLINTQNSNEIQAYYNLSRPFNNKTYEITLTGNASLSQYSFYNNSLKTVNTYKINQSIEFAYNKNWGEFGLGYGIATNQFAQHNTILSTIDHSVKERSVFFAKDTKFGFDISFIKPNGYFFMGKSDEIYLVNAFVERKIKTKLTVRIEGNDLLDQSYINYTRQVASNHITDYSYNAIGRYVMVSLIYKVNKFAK